MLHWPDTMFTYMTGENILFSNDAFGQHYASEHMFNDMVDQSELYAQAIKYYANILTPFNKFVQKKIEEVVALNVPVSMICTSHGIIWRYNPLQIVEKYMEWSKGIFVGSSTINNGILSSTAGLLEMIKGLGFKNKKAGAFGSYGWSGECVKNISEVLKEAGFEMAGEGLRELWVPDDKGFDRCMEFGKSIL